MSGKINFSKNQIKNMIAAYSTSESTKNLALTFGISMGTYRKILKENDVKMRKSGNMKGKLLKDHTGKLINGWNIIEFIKFTKDSSTAVYRVKCKCGKILAKTIGNMKRVNKCSNCQHVSQRSAKSEAGLSLLYAQYRNKAKIKNRSFNISKKRFKILTLSDCFYCGIKPAHVMKSHSASLEAAQHGAYVYNGLDRIDNKLGYTKKNVVPCCEQCNRGKLDYSQEEFLNWAKRLYLHVFKI